MKQLRSPSRLYTALVAGCQTAKGEGTPPESMLPVNLGLSSI